MALRDSLSRFMRSTAVLLFCISLTLGMVSACGDDSDPQSPDGGSIDAGADAGVGDVDGGDIDGGVDCVDNVVEEFPDGPYGRPEEVMPKGFECPPGGLAEVDLDGRWSLVGSGPFDFQMPLLRESCEKGLQVELGGIEDPLIHRDDTNLFVRAEVQFGMFVFTVAARFCGVAGSDELTVALGTCFQENPDAEPQCGEEIGRMTRFARPSGEAEADGLELVSEWSGGGEPWPQATATNVKVVDGVAFVSRLLYKNGDTTDLRLVDVSNPEKPRDLGSIPGDEKSGAGADYNDVKLFTANGGTHAILAGISTPIVDARDPARPAIVAQLGEFCHSVFVRQEPGGRPLAYLATTGNTPDVPVYDLSDPGRPVLVERVPLPPSPDNPQVTVGIHDLYADEDRLYLNAGFDGFIIMDRVGDDWVVGGTTPTGGYSHASWVGQVADRQLAIHGDEGYNAHLRVIDVDPTSKEFMTTLGEYATRPEVSIHNIMLFGDRAYIAYYHDGLRILDLADPANPQLVAHYHTWDIENGPGGPFEGAIGLDVDRGAGLIYVADISRGLLILRETK